MRRSTTMIQWRQARLFDIFGTLVGPGNWRVAP